MTVYNISTNLDPEKLTQVALEIFRHWMEFALGRVSIGGKLLKHPTGKYASAISWRRTGQYTVSIIADSSISKQVDTVEHGAKAFDLKAIMLAKKSKIGADGHRYRVVALPSDLDNDPGAGAMMNAGTIESIVTGGKNGQKVKSNIAKMWAKPIRRTKYRVMSDKNPGSWQIPARIAYNPALILSQLIQKDYGK